MVQNCHKCGNEMIATSVGWKCRSCLGFVDMQGNFYEHKENPFMPPMTNADRIRAMSDEELADFIHQLRTNLAMCAILRVEPMNMGIEWLKQPAEE